MVMTASNVAPARQRGTLIKLPDSTPGLLVIGTEQKSFVLEGLWRSPTPPAVGLSVEVELSADGAVTGIHAVDTQQVALEHGQKVADAARNAALRIVPVMGKPALIACQRSIGAWCRSRSGRCWASTPVTSLRSLAAPSPAWPA
jgi:hypothetical protein